MKKLNKNKIYQRRNWLIDKPLLAFAWNGDYNYFAYIDNLEAIAKARKNTLIKFIFNRENKPSKVGEHVLTSSDLQDVQGIEVIHQRGLYYEYEAVAKRINKQNRKGLVMKNKDYVGAYNIAKVELDISYIDELLDDVFSHDCAFVKLDKQVTYKSGDLILIDHPDGLMLGKIVTVYTGEILNQESIEASNRAHYWVIDKIDVTKHLERIKATERKKFILAELQRRKEAIEEKAVWEMLAKQDNVAKELLEELNILEMRGNEK